MFITYNLLKKTEAENGDSDKLLLAHTTDRYKGIRMSDSSKLPTNKKAFESRLRYSVNQWRKNGNRGCWIKLTTNLFDRLSFCVSLGFEVHHANSEYIMLQMWLPQSEESMIPSYAYSYMGAHAFIINDNHQMVVMKEHYGDRSWKIPGGAIDFSEHAIDAAVRESKEESGLDCECLGVLAVRHLLNFRFGTTCDVSFICLLRPKDLKQRLQPMHLNEVKDIRWIEVDEFIKSEQHLFLGQERENLDLLKKAADWTAKYWNNWDCEEAKKESPCIQKFKQTHPYYPTADIALYHR